MSKKLQDLLKVNKTIPNSVMLVKDNQSGVFQDQEILVTDLLKDLIPKVDAPYSNPKTRQIVRLIDDGTGNPALPKVSGKFLTDMDITVSDATNTVLGKTKLSDSITSTLTALSGHTAASPYAVKLVNDKKPDTAGTETITGTWKFNKITTHQQGFVANAGSIINAHLELNQSGIKTSIEGISGKGSGILNVTYNKGIYLPNTIAPQFRDGSNYYSIYHTGYKPNASDVGLSNLSKEANGQLKIQTSTGYTLLGSGNTTWSHFDTDRGGFYFAKKALFDGDIVSYKHQNTKIADNGQIIELGQRVYSPNNKPSPATLGAYTKAEVDSRLDLRIPKATQDYDPDAVKASRNILIGTTNGSTSGLAGSRGFIHLPVSTKNAIQLGLRSINGDYSIRGIGDNGVAGAWTRLYHTGYKPTSNDVGAYSKAEADAKYFLNTGGTISGAVMMNMAGKGVRLVGDSSAGYIQAGNFTTGSTQKMILSGILGAKLDSADFIMSANKNLTVNGNEVYHTGNKPSWNDIQTKPSIVIQHGSATLTDLSITGAGKLSLGGWSLNNATNGNLTFSVGGGLKTYITSTGDFHSTSLWDNGARVYSPNNKPSWGDVTGKPNVAVQNSSATFSGLNLNANNAFITVNSGTGTGSYLLGKVNSANNWYVGKPSGSNDNIGLHSYIFNNGIEIRSSGIYYVTGSSSGKLYSELNKPTATDTGALPVGGKAADSNLLDGINSTGFGLVTSTATVSLSKVVRDGFYRINSGNTDTPPFDVRYGQMIVSTGESSDTTMQIVSDYRSANIAWRSFNKSTAGGDWNTIYHSGNKPKAVDIEGVVDFGTF